MYIPGRTYAYCRYMHGANLDGIWKIRILHEKTEIEVVQVVETCYLFGEGNCCVVSPSVPLELKSW
jgi:hypothetical protein